MFTKNQGTKSAAVIAAVIMCIFMGFALSACSAPADNPDTPKRPAGDVLLDENWQTYQGKGALSLAIAAGNCGESAPRLVKQQLDGEWIIHTHLTYLSAPENGDNHAGLTLYKDSENYLVWGPRNNGQQVFSGKINGKDTGVIATSDGKFVHLRIWKNLTDAPCPRYYVYAATDSYYSWSYAGYFDDTDGVFDSAKVGVIGLDYDAASAKGYCAQFEFLNDYKLYMYRDNFNDPMQVIDGRWSAGADNAKSKNSVLTLSAASNTPSLLLRNPLSYAWTIEAMTYGEVKSGVYSAVCAEGSGGTLSIGIIGGKAEARINDTVLGTADGDFCFVKIIMGHDGTYSLRASETGRSWTEVACYTQPLGDNMRYGLMSAGGDSAFDWFCERPTPDGVIKDVASFENVARITGEDSINKTETRFGWGSGDLGTMFELNGSIYMAFGDTFQYVNQRGAYYKNSMAKISDPDSFSDGVLFEWMKINPGNGGMINSRNPSDPTSMIPTSSIGIVQDGVPTMYLHIMEIRQWTSHGTHWTVNGSGWASSTDEGNTWTLHERIFEGDTNFAQVACCQIEDYVYILGAGPGGEGPVKLCRVLSAHIVEKEHYEFFIGTDAGGNPKWSPKEDDAVVVIDSVNKEFGVVYDEGLGCFIMTTLDNVNQQMILRDAENIWGPWSKPVLLFDESYIEHEDVGQRFFYGSYMHSRFMENGGKTVYMTLSKWVPYNIEWMKVNFEVDGKQNGGK